MVGSGQSDSKGSGSCGRFCIPEILLAAVGIKMGTGRQGAGAGPWWRAGCTPLNGFGLSLWRNGKQGPSGSSAFIFPQFLYGLTLGKLMVNGAVT